VLFHSIGLKADLGNKLFGQHIASDIIFKAVSGFMDNEHPKKPLVLSLHGPTGTGKNFVSQLIAENIYEKGKARQFVHVFSATHHFPHPSEIVTYKSQLQEWIKSNITNGERSMFIFNNVDKMPPGLIDSIKPFLSHHVQMDGISFQKSIFMFLSNVGEDVITQTALDFWNKGRKREGITLKDLETSLSQFSNDQSGIIHSGLIDNNMVDFFIPFLPLEYRHVIQCVMAEMKAIGFQPDKDVADRVVRDISHVHLSENVFVKSGCMTVASRLYLYM
ncbi:torsin-1B-like, partial [Pelmatolapia mariae]|uniref:torsin-1B-like n=1 Tax=Pelmatolapia mariae TaxID=158779 RepID=UPI002FE6874C